MSKLSTLVLLPVFALWLLPASVKAIEPVTLLFEAPSALKAIGEYLGLIESLDSKVERLLDVDLKTATSLFEQAKANPSKAGDLIKDARIHFTRAAAMQSDSQDETRRLKRALALLGLWACCKHSDDTVNAQRTLEEIATISEDPSSALQVKYQLWKSTIGKTLSLKPWTNSLVGVSIENPPKLADYRAFSSDLDSLCKIIEATDKKIFDSTPVASRPSIVGKWSGTAGGTMSVTKEFFGDGTAQTTTAITKVRHDYRLLDDRRVEFTTKGILYGTNKDVWSYRVYSNVLILRAEGPMELTLQLKRVVEASK